MPPSQELFKLSSREQARLGLPDGFELFTPAQMGGLNYSDSRIGMDDADFYWLENFIRLGKNNYRTLPDQGAALYTAPAGKTIVYFDAFNIGATNYFAVFLDDGTAIQVNASTGATTTISSTSHTFYNSSLSTQIPIGGQWGAEFLLIGNNFSTNNYWVWDGSLLYTSGTLGPLPVITNTGSGYSSAPTVSAYGGSGSGATFLATISGGAVVSLSVTNPGSGYQPTDIVQLRFSGGGSDSEAQLTAVLASGTISSVVITDGGSGYTDGDYALGFSGGGGTGAAGTYTVTGGVVVSTSISAGGSGYTGQPTITFPSGGGADASGFAVLNPGSVASVTVNHGGSNFTGTPTLTFVGGGGSGATGTAVVSGGAITSVTITNGGSGYTSTPAVEVTTGYNNAAHATITLMPYGISGSSLETYQSRVWLGFPFQTGSFQTNGLHNGDVILVSAPSSLNDFATSSGGVSFVNTDRFLAHQYTNIRQSNGYLYPMGDSSISVISNVQTSGSPPTTTFNYQNTDPQIGTSWRDSVAAFSRTILFGNPLGAFGLYGGAVTKISGKIDQIFTDLVLPENGGVTPSSAVANIYSKRVFLMNATIKDPFTGATATKLLCWDEKEWFVASQSSSYTYITTQEINSTLYAWGTDGNSIYPMFTTPSASIRKKMSSKLYGANASVIQKQAYVFAVQAQDKSSDTSGISLSVTTDTNYLNPDTAAYTYPLPSGDIALTGASPTYPISIVPTGGVYGMDVGFTLTSTSKDFCINFAAIGYMKEAAQLALSEG